MDEKQIIEGIRAKGEQYFPLVVERYGGAVFSTIVRIVGSSQDAEELTQDVFMKVFDNIHRYRGESSLSTWIYRIAYNLAVSKIRRPKKELPASDKDALSGIAEPADEAPPDQRLQLLEKALQELPTDEAMLVTLFYYRDKSVAELSSITGLTEANVKVRLHRIRKKLYICIREDETD